MCFITHYTTLCGGKCTVISYDMYKEIFGTDDVLQTSSYQEKDYPLDYSMKYFMNMLWCSDRPWGFKSRRWEPYKLLFILFCADVLRNVQLTWIIWSFKSYASPQLIQPCFAANKNVIIMTSSHSSETFQCAQVVLCLMDPFWYILYCQSYQGNNMLQLKLAYSKVFFRSRYKYKPEYICHSSCKSNIIFMCTVVISNITVFKLS